MVRPIWPLGGVTMTVPLATSVKPDWLLFGDPKGLSADAYQLLIVSPPDISNGA